MSTVLVVGSTGQIGRVVVEQALAQGITPRAQTRSAARTARSLPEGTEIVEAQPASVDSVRPLVARVDGVIFTHGGEADGHGGRSFFDIVATLLEALSDQPAVPISLMTSMRTSVLPAEYEFVAWKRRAERLLRASGHRYTIVRPGWFGYQRAEERSIELLQGDLVREQRGVDPRHVAQVLLAGLSIPSAARRTVEVFSAQREPVVNFEGHFAPTRPDEAGALDGILDADHVALADEPQDVQDTIGRLRH